MSTSMSMTMSSNIADLTNLSPDELDSPGHDYDLSDESTPPSISRTLHSIDGPLNHTHQIINSSSPPSLTDSPSQSTTAVNGLTSNDNSPVVAFQQYHQQHFSNLSSSGSSTASTGLYRFHDESHEHGPGASGRPKRRQVRNACTNCQKACKKCDDARPCLRCVKYGIGDGCVNSQRKERKKGVKRGPYKKRDGKTDSADITDSRGDYTRQRHGTELMPIMAGLVPYGYPTMPMSYPGAPYIFQSAPPHSHSGQSPQYPAGTSSRAGEYPANVQYAPYYPHLPHYPIMHPPAFMLSPAPYPSDSASGSHSSVDNPSTKKHQ